MKQIFTVFTLLFLGVNTINAQQIKYTDLSTSTKGEYTSYISSNGAVYKVGDKIKIGKPNGTNFAGNSHFVFITQGVYPVTYLPSTASGQEVEIINIYVTGNKRTGYSVNFKTKGHSLVSNYTIYIENALEKGEVIGFGKTSDEALAELKKAKDKLDLGLINQDEYDKIKSELVQYIK
jgi:hypothetical protein